MGPRDHTPDPSRQWLSLHSARRWYYNASKHTTIGMITTTIANRSNEDNKDQHTNPRDAYTNLNTNTPRLDL